MKACRAPGLAICATIGAVLLPPWPASSLAEESQAKTEERLAPASKAEYERGRKQARDQIARNVLALEQPGLPAPWMGDYSSKLRKDYQVELHLAGCVITPDFLSFMQGFNEVMVEEIEKRYGKDVLRKAAEEAQKQFQARSSSISR